MKKKKNSAKQIVLPIVVSLSLSIGVLVGMLVSSEPSVKNKVSLLGFKYKQVLQLLEQDYVDTVDVENLAEHSINKLLEELDPHSRYIDKESKEVVESQLQSKFEGVGIEFQIIQDTLWVTNVVAGGPSSLAGLRMGDKIITVNDSSIAGIDLSVNDVFTTLRGPSGSQVDLRIKRFGTDSLIDFTVTRGQIPTNSVSAAYMVDDSTGVIGLSRFAEDTYSEFYGALQDLNQQGMRRLVLDLRGNGGGYLNQAVKVLEEFLPRGTLLVSTIGKNNAASHAYQVTKGGVFQSQPIALLVDEYSASASEIVAGALQDNDRAWVVGRRTYGKGLVQATYDLLDGSSLRLTVSRYYTPSGRCIQRPYHGDLEEYDLDLDERRQSGELFSKDSIEVNQELEYRTSGGRIVYAGGGIVPDVFVPKDSGLTSPTILALINQKVFNVYSIQYALSEIDTLKNMGKESYLNDFDFDKDDWETFRLLAWEKYDVLIAHLSDEEKDFIKLYLKAIIAKHVWDDNMYHRVIQNNDADIFAAIDRLNAQPYVVTD